MNRDGHNNVKFFIGPEVETTPAASKKTLFVVGFQDTAEIEKHAREHKVKHIFFGANHSFDMDFDGDKTYFSKTWNDVVTYFLDRGYMVTLDYPAHQHKDVLSVFTAGVWQSRNFVPLLSVRIPHIETSNPNLTVKIDDIDFAATNAGVWCLHFRELTDSNRFTGWGDYGTDQVIDDQPSAEPERKIFHVDVGDLAPEVAETAIKTAMSGLQEPEVPIKDTTVKNDETAGLDLTEKVPVPEETPVTDADALAAYVEPVKKTANKKKDA